MKKIGRKIKISHYIMSVMLIAVLLFNEFLLSFSQLIAPTEIETSALSEKGETVGLTGTKIAANLKDYIGKEVDWHTQNPATQDIKWKILYADNTGLYLIASDFVDITTQTPKKNRFHDNYTAEGPFALTTKATNYQGYWTKDLCTQYSTYRPIGTSTYTGISYSFLRGQFYSLSSWTAVYEERDKAAANYMLDYTIWNPLYDSPDLMYAWGGPTLEIMDKAYKTEDPSLSTFYELGNFGYSIPYANYNIGKSTRSKLLAKPKIQSGIGCDFATWFIAPNSVSSKTNYNVYEELYDNQVGNKMYIGNSYNMNSSTYDGNAWANVLNLGTTGFNVRISTCCRIKEYSCS